MRISDLIPAGAIFEQRDIVAAEVGHLAGVASRRIAVSVRVKYSSETSDFLEQLRASLIVETSGSGGVFCLCDKPASTSAPAPRWLSFDSTRSSISSVSRQRNPENCHLASGWKEIAVARPHVVHRSHARAAAQNELTAHELAIVFANSACP